MKTLTELLNDNFSVDFAGRTERGDLRLASTVFRAKKTPAPLFGQNIRDFGLEFALAEASYASPKPHEFGYLYIKDKSLRCLNGKWYVDVSVDRNMARMCPVWKQVVETDEEGNVIFDASGDSIPRTDENGAPMVYQVQVRESFLTMELSQLEPVEHPLATEYVQSDSRTRALVATGARSYAASQGRKAGGGRKKGQKSERIKRGSRHYAEALQKAAK